MIALVVKATLFVLVLEQPSIDVQTVVEHVIAVQVGAPVGWCSFCRHVLRLLDAERRSSAAGARSSDRPHSSDGLRAPVCWNDWLGPSIATIYIRSLAPTRLTIVIASAARYPAW
jgi:hypothetical protein